MACVTQPTTTTEAGAVSRTDDLAAAITAFFRALESSRSRDALEVQLTPTEYRALARVVEVEAGHALMTEAPGEVLDALRDFLAA